MLVTRRPGTLCKRTCSTSGWQRSPLTACASPASSGALSLSAQALGLVLVPESAHLQPTQEVQAPMLMHPLVRWLAVRWVRARARAFIARAGTDADASTSPLVGCVPAADPNTVSARAHLRSALTLRHPAPPRPSHQVHTQALAPVLLPGVATWPEPGHGRRRWCRGRGQPGWEEFGCCATHAAAVGRCGHGRETAVAASEPRLIHFCFCWLFFCLSGYNSDSCRNRPGSRVASATGTHRKCARGRGVARC